jgi:hypothetical protein
MYPAFVKALPKEFGASTSFKKQLQELLTLKD